MGWAGWPGLLLHLAQHAHLHTTLATAWHHCPATAWAMPQLLAQRLACWLLVLLLAVSCEL